MAIKLSEGAPTPDRIEVVSTLLEAALDWYDAIALLEENPDDPDYNENMVQAILALERAVERLQPYVERDNLN